MKNQRVQTGVHHIDGLGNVVITGMLNAQCDVMPEPQTIVEDVKFWYGTNDTLECKPNVWEHYEEPLKQALVAFGEVDRYIQYSKNLIAK